MNKRILVSAGGTAAAWNIVNKIKQNFKDHFEVLVCDINPHYLVPSSKIADGFMKVPSIFEENYYKYMLELFAREKIDIYVPIIDFDLEIFPKDNPDLLKIGTYSTAPDSNITKLTIDKLEINKYLSKHGLPVPKIFSVNEVSEDLYYFVKPRKGFGSQGARKMLGKDIINELDDSKWVIQEVLNNPEVTVEIFYHKNNVRTVCRERLEVKAGVCTKARIFHDNVLNELVKKLVKVLPLPVASCIQVMKDQNNDWRITDINLRLGAGTALSSCAGWDLTSSALAVWGGLDYDPMIFLGNIDKEKFVVRYYQEMIV